MIPSPNPNRAHPALIVLVTLLMALPAAAQQASTYTILGTVVDGETGEPLPDVAVTLRGTSAGAVTDAEGAYRFDAELQEGTYTLAFALIGRERVTRTVDLADQAQVRVPPVALDVSAVELEDIVVTGVGVRSQRKALGNTVETISGEEVSEAPGTQSVDVALQGKVTGAVISQHTGQPGGGASVRLRGTSTILGNAEPLYVIDGVIVDNSSEALISLGANAGRGNVSLSNRLSDLVPGEIDRIEVLKGAAAAGLYGSRANSGVIQIFTKQGTAGAPRITFRTEVSVSETPATYDLNMAPTAGVGDVTFGGVPGLEVGDPVERHDIQDRLFRTGLGTTNQLSISGGSAETSYYVAGSYGFEEGIFEGTNYEKLSVRGKLAQRVFEDLEVTVNASYTDSESSFVPEGEQVQGPLTNVIFTPTVFDYSFDPELGRFPYTPVLGANPLDVIENWEAPENVTRFIGAAEAVLTPVDPLTVRYQFGLDDYRQENRYLQPPLATGPNFTGSIQNPIRFSQQINHDLTAEFRTPLSEATEFTTTAGFSYTTDRVEVVRAAAQDLPPRQRLVGGATQFASQGINEIRTLGGFLQEQVGFGGRLFFTAGVNAEGSSSFGPDERTQFFPRASASWLVHEEGFWADGGIGDLFSTFRVRAAYGETGGQPPGAFIRFNTFGDVAFAGLPGLVAGEVRGNPGLQPERQREIEGGFELGAFGDRALLEFTVYDRLTTDLVLLVPLSPSSGFQSQFQNIGEISNRGVEASLSTTNLQRDDFTWRSRLQLSSNRNRVEELVTDADTISAVGGGYPNYIVEGQPLGVFYGGFYARDESGDVLYDEEGLPVRATVPGGSAFASKIIGDPTPDLVASLSNTFRIGDALEASFLLDGRFGNDVANFTRRITQFFGVDEAVEREISGDTIPGTFTLNGSRIGLYEEYIEDGSFVKLREVALRYSLDGDFLDAIGARAMEIRLAGRNLGTWTDYSGLDPEVNLFGANPAARGVDFANTPIPRSYALGLTFRF